MSPTEIDALFRDDLYQLLRAIEYKRILLKRDSQLEISNADVSLKYIKFDDLLKGVAGDYGIEISEAIPSGYIPGPNDDFPGEFMPDGGNEKYVINLKPDIFNKQLEDIVKDYNYRNKPLSLEPAVESTTISPESTSHHNNPAYPLFITSDGNVVYGEETVELHPQLLRLCKFLIEHHGRSFSKIELLRVIADDDAIGGERDRAGKVKLSKKENRRVYTCINKLDWILNSHFNRHVIKNKPTVGYMLKCDDI